MKSSDEKVWRYKKRVCARGLEKFVLSHRNWILRVPHVFMRYRAPTVKWKFCRHQERERLIHRWSRRHFPRRSTTPTLRYESWSSIKLYNYLSLVMPHHSFCMEEMIGSNNLSVSFVGGRESLFCKFRWKR